VPSSRPLVQTSSANVRHIKSWSLHQRVAALRDMLAVA
jgi:hypothetical protein